MSLDFGIYLGGSSMVIAYSREGKTDVIVNEAGDRTTPSGLSINNNDYSIGLPVKQNLIRNAQNTILYAKDFIGNSIDSPELQIILKKVYCQVSSDDNKQIVFNLEKDDKPFAITLNQAIELELKYLFDLAQSNLGVKDNLNAVLAVPDSFNSEQSEFLSNCAKNVGFNIQRVIRNPFAAALAYEREDDYLKTRKLLVYQLGGSNLEVTLIDLVNGLYRKIGSITNNQIGGDDFTDVIVNILCDEFKRKNKSMDPRENKRSIFKLKSNADYLKNILSTMERAHCSIDALYEGIDFDYYLTRQRFEGACSKIYENCLQPIDQILSDNNLNPIEIDKVIVCGAATKMCKLQSLIRDKFPSTTQFLNQLAPDEIVAIGCAKQSSIITNTKCKKLNENDTKFQCLPCEIFMRIGNETNENDIQIFPNLAPIPIKRKLNANLENDLPFVLFIFERLNNRLLTKIDLKSFTTKELSCSFQIKLDGTFEISITETSTNQTITAYLNSEC